MKKYKLTAKGIIFMVLLRNLNLELTEIKRIGKEVFDELCDFELNNL